MTDKELSELINSHKTDKCLGIETKVTDKLLSETIVLTVTELIRLIQLIQTGEIS